MEEGRREEEREGVSEGRTEEVTYIEGREREKSRQRTSLCDENVI